MAIRIEDIAEQGCLRLFAPGVLDESSRLEEKMRGWPGVVKVHFEAETGRLEYGYNPFITDTTRIMESLRGLGYEVREEQLAVPGKVGNWTDSPGRIQETFSDSKSSVIRLEGLDCADCAAKLERSILAISGVEEARVNFAASKMKISHQIPLSEVLGVIEKMGYRGSEEGNPAAEERISLWKSNKYYLSTLLSGMLLLLAISLQLLQISEFWTHSSYLLAIVLGG
ncbi:MAG: heavy metal-associated domain-containing protein, partial [Syntrophomonas sp.]|uniref:cation transporter n=1 Tax=Syntrophomonas sp. TaxID=2053627 RepID=UPI0026026B48